MPGNRESTVSLLIFVQIFIRDVVFLDLVRPDFALIRIGNVLYALNNFSFERVPFL